jgi:hypothetical protein
VPYEAPTCTVHAPSRVSPVGDDVTSLHALPGISARLFRLVDSDAAVIASGCFSRIYSLSARQVLKVTCCPATVLLFDELLMATVAPKRLPSVFERFGAVAEDEDGATYIGYRVERLLEPCPPTPVQLALVAQAQDLRHLSQYVDADESAYVSAAMARHLASVDCWEISPTWEFLADFILRTGTVLDSIAVRNLMVRRDGNLVLADPVAEISLPLPKSLLAPQTLCDVDWRGKDG